MTNLLLFKPIKHFIDLLQIFEGVHRIPKDSLHSRYYFNHILAVVGGIVMQRITRAAEYPCTLHGKVFDRVPMRSGPCNVTRRIGFIPRRSLANYYTNIVSYPRRRSYGFTRTCALASERDCSGLGVIFRVKKSVEYGEHVRLVGSCTYLGEWNVGKSKGDMVWSEGDVWEV